MIKGIIFDLDGTLVDTLDDLTDAMNAALTRCGCPVRTPIECRQMIGSGVRMFAQRALPDDKKHLTDELFTKMIAYYHDHCLSKTKVYDGIKEVLTVLSERGIRLAVLTNKHQNPTDLIVRHYFGDETFAPVVGVVEGRKVKPDPTSTLEIIDDWGLKPDDVLYVGDSDVDIQTAKNAQIRCLGCLWGFRSKEQLIAAGAETLIEHPRQILDNMGINSKAGA